MGLVAVVNGSSVGLRLFIDVQSNSENYDGNEPDDGDQ